MPVPLPGPTTRWRCEVCGNLTRFTVVRRARVREFVHVDLAGSATVEESTVLDETAEQVVCRWCNTRDRVALEPRPAAQAGGG